MVRSQDGLLWKSLAKTRVESTLASFTPHQEMIDTASKVVIASYTVAGFSRRHSFIRDFVFFSSATFIYSRDWQKDVPSGEQCKPWRSSADLRSGCCHFSGFL